MLTMPARPVFSPLVRKGAEQALLQDGAWLLLTIDHYAWRGR